MKFGFFSDESLPESAHGYRCPSWDPIPDGKKNVVVLGCSHTWGVGLEDDEHWVHHLSKHNTERLRYWNLGQPGASGDKIVRTLLGCEKTIHPKIIIICWPVWSRREKLSLEAQSLTGDADQLKYEDNFTDKNNFLKNIFFVEKFAEHHVCKTFHCFAEQSYAEHIEGLNVLKHYTLANCWPYWDRFKQRKQYKEPSLAADGKHYGVQHHERFAQLFLEKFRGKLK